MGETPTLANPKSCQGAQIVLIELVLWLWFSVHLHAMLPPMDLTGPMVWSVGRSGSHFMQCTLPTQPSFHLFWSQLDAGRTSGPRLKVYSRRPKAHKAQP